MTFVFPPPLIPPNTRIEHVVPDSDDSKVEKVYGPWSETGWELDVCPGARVSRCH